MIIQSQAVRVPVKLVTALGADATGIVVADIKNGRCQAVKATGVTVNIALVLNTNFFEIDATNSPGLYHITLPNTTTDVLGPLQYSVYPTTNAFLSSNYTETVQADSSADITAIKAKTDNLPAAPANEATSTAIKAKTDLIPAIPASQGDVTGAVTSIKGASNKDNTQITTAITAAQVSIKGVSDIDLTQVAGTGFSTANDSLKQLSTAIAAISTNGVAAAVWDKVRSLHVTSGTFGEAIRIVVQALRGHVKIDTLNNTLIVYQEDNTTPLYTSALRDPSGNAANVYATDRLAGV